MKYIDRFLDNRTMYWLLEYGLIALLGIAMMLSAFGVMTMSPIGLGLSAGYLVLVCVVTNKIFGKVFGAATNPESSIITALILALIVSPARHPSDILFLSAAGGLAIASKYILSFRKAHIFNPAAIAVVLTALGAGQSASWWVGTTVMAPFVLVGGLLLLRKIRRVQMLVAFFSVAIISTTGFTLFSGGNPVTTLSNAFLHSSLLFMAFVMLTEPLTSPRTNKKQIAYGVFAGLIIPPQVHVLGVYSTPELVLVASNILSFAISQPTKRMLTLVRKLDWGPTTQDFIFKAPKLKYLPGQYMEFTLPHASPDSRGSRRYFTLASSPTEKDLRVGIKFYEGGSSYKKSLELINSKSVIAADQLSGDFTLPGDKTKKLAFIAGGIGVTPFRSMIKYLIDTRDPRTVNLIYSERIASDLAYSDVFNEAQDLPNMNITYTITGTDTETPSWMRRGYITAELIKTEIPDYGERIFYISGSHAMVSNVQQQLSVLGVPLTHVKIDFFPGYA